MVNRRERCSVLILGALAFALATRPSRGEEEVPPLFVEGYTGRISYRAGETLGLHVSTSAKEFSVEIVRHGARPETVWSRRAVPGKRYPVPADASARGCRWPEALRVEVPETWKSGYYSIIMQVADYGGEFTQYNRRTAQGGTYFIVRPAHPGRDARILLEVTTNTYNAYNNWGGYSLYAYNARDKVQGRRVSFDRPQQSQFSRWEQPFVAWAERAGYALDYAANTDLEFHPELLDHYRLVLSVGHDEYWSAPMRDHLEAFLAKGGNIAFFSGDSITWQVRTEEEGRALVCYKEAFAQDPVYRTGDHRLLTTLWSHHLVNRPENQLFGVGFLFGGYHKSHGYVMDGTGGFTVHRPEHWIFQGTGLKRGDLFGAADTIVGYECDGCEYRLEGGLPVPTHSDGTPDSFVILASAPAEWAPAACEWYDRWEKGRKGTAMLGTFTRVGTVVTAATTDWAHGLARPDPVVDRITRNILDRLSK